MDATRAGVIQASEAPMTGLASGMGARYRREALSCTIGSGRSYPILHRHSNVTEVATVLLVDEPP